MDAEGRRIKVARSAGFCFGVKRAVETCYEQAAEGKKPVYTYGPIIHNEQVVEDLEQRGVHVLEGEADLQTVTDGTVIIRSHGVSADIYEKIRSRGLTLVDATCPFVLKIHRIVEEKSKNSLCDLVIIGNPEHPEVQGIRGWASRSVSVLETVEDAERFVKEHTGKTHGRTLCVVSQTTFNFKKFNNLVEILLKLRYDSNDVLNTICNATEDRQNEARELAITSDAMIVIGGKHSSNTQKLYEICKKECEHTFYIQKLVDLDLRLLPSSGCLGITAGASTPNNLIEEVSKRCQN